MRLKAKEIFKVMHDAGFLYKGKTITDRTVRTMFDNGFFSSMVKEETSKFRTVLESEVLNKIEEQK